MEHSMKRMAIAIMTAGALASGTLDAAAEDKAAAREREMLRRTQQALKAEQEQRSTAEREKGALAAEKAKLQDDVKKNSAQLASVQAKSRASLSQIAGMQSELEQLKAAKVADEQAQDALKRDVSRLTQQLAQTQRTLAERTSANQTLIAVLERSIEALANAETKNRELHAAGLKAVDAYKNKGVGAALSQREPVFGFGAVQVENLAEGLRTQIDAQRIPSAFKREPLSDR